MEAYLTSYALWVWVSAGMTLMFLEIVMGFPIAMFICGLSAFTTAVALWLWPGLENSTVYQIIIFLAGIPCWALALWKPLNNALQKSHTRSSFSNIIGKTAIAGIGGLVKGETGNILWSGTIVKARLVDNDEKEVVNSGEHVRILEVKENIFIVKSMVTQSSSRIG